MYAVYENGVESTVCLTTSAGELLALCDGTRTITEIIDIISKMYHQSHSAVSKRINRFIDESTKYSTIEMHESRADSSLIQVIGGASYWTPSFAALELTKRCPLSCIYCYADAESAESGLEMDRSRLTALLDEIVDLGIIRVQLTGGEPTSYKYFPDVIEFLTRAKIYSVVITNGMNSDNKTLAALSKLSNHHGRIQVSLDGPEAVHNKYRKNNTSYSKAIEMIKWAISKGIEVDVASTLVSQSPEQLREVCRLLKSLGVHTYRIGFLINQGRGSKLSKTDIKLILPELLAVKDSEQTDSFRIAIDEEQDEKLKSVRKNYCGAGCRTVIINSDFSVYPCPAFPFPLGSIMNQSIDELFSTLKNGYSEIESPSVTICGSCEYFDQCNRCIARGLENSSRVEECNWLLFHNRILKELSLLE